MQTPFVKIKQAALRIVHIGGYDSCPCLGRHVTHTGEIGRFRLLGYTYTPGKLRLRYKTEATEAQSRPAHPREK